MNNQTENKPTKIKVDWDFLFANSKVELWSLTLFLLFSVAASLLRLLQKRRNGNAVGRVDAESGPASGRPADEADGDVGGTATIHEGDEGADAERSGGNGESEERNGKATLEFRRTLGRTSWRW